MKPTNTSQSSIIAILLAFVCTAHAMIWSAPNNAFSMNTTVDGDKIRFDFKTNVKGWIAVGFGSNMNDADMLVMYTTPQASIVSSRFTVGHAMPQKNKEMILKKYDQPSQVPTSNFAYLFARSVKGDGQRVATIPTGPVKMIWAWSDQPVTDDAKLAKHNEQGTMTLELLGPKSSASLNRISAASVSMIAVSVLLGLYM